MDRLRDSVARVNDTLEEDHFRDSFYDPFQQHEFAYENVDELLQFLPASKDDLLS
jgi:hypothetical protein